jgi:hypothetical protein
MSVVIPFAPTLRDPTLAANSGLPIHLYLWRREIAEVIPHLRRLSDLGDMPPSAHAALVNDTLPPLLTGIVLAHAMARTAQDHLVMAALLRAITHAKAAAHPEAAHSALTIRVSLASAADALVTALAEANPVLWAAAAPLFDDTVEGGAA